MRRRCAAEGTGMRRRCAAEGLESYCESFGSYNE